MQTTPIVYDGVMYLTFGRTTVAIDATTCRERWTHTWQPKGHEISTTNRGAAIKDGRLVRGTADGYLIALDMGGGSLFGAARSPSAACSQYLSAPPLIYRFVIAACGADFGARMVGAFKLETGEPVWQFNLIPDPGEPGTERWQSPESLKHGGGSIWTPLSLDAKGRHPLSAGRQSGARFLRRAPARREFYPTRSSRWMPRRASCSGTASHPPRRARFRSEPGSPLFETTIDGKQREVISVSGKDGLLRLLDRDSHDQFYEVPITTRENVDAIPPSRACIAAPVCSAAWSGTARLTIPAATACSFRPSTGAVFSARRRRTRRSCRACTITAAR